MLFQADNAAALSMKISVITVAKNAAGTIQDTLRSVQAQDYPDVEHLIVDGRSTDATLTVVEKHGRHVARVVSEKDSGVYEAFNRGLKLASGDIIAFLNADDFYDSDQLLSQIAAQFQLHDVDVLFGDVLLVRADDTRSIVRYYSSRSFVPARLARGFMPAHPSMFVRRSVYDHFGGFNASYRIAGDFEWVARVFGHSPIRYRHLPKVFVRMREGGLSTRGIRSTVRITREIRRACSEQGIATNYLKLLSRFPEKMLEYYSRPKAAHGRRQPTEI
jgi:glycosyltransferase involved in cell wall biosynthesis